MVGFVNAIQDYWGNTLNGYELAPTTFFTGQTNTGCGTATSAVGPFYCPEDRNVYIDLGFFDQLEGAARRRRRAAGRGLRAGARVRTSRPEPDRRAARAAVATPALSRGSSGPSCRPIATPARSSTTPRSDTWSRSAREQLAQALDAAAAVGDDRIQERTQGQVDPETWTHGSSEQRQRWLRVGWESGDPNQCDTFNTDNL